MERAVCALGHGHRRQARRRRDALLGSHHEGVDPPLEADIDPADARDPVDDHHRAVLARRCGDLLHGVREARRRLVVAHRDGLEAPLLEGPGDAGGVHGLSPLELQRRRFRVHLAQVVEPLAELPVH